MANNTFPEDWRDQPCFLVPVPRPLVPFVGGFMKIAEQRGFWQSEDDFKRGYQAVIEMEECLMATCLDVLLAQNDAIYRLLNTSLRGQEYIVVSDDPLVIEPSIEPVVSLGFVDQNSVIGYLDRQAQLVDNTLNGTETPLYSYTPSVKEQLQAIIDALATEDTDLGDLLTQLELIVGLLA